MLVLTRSAGQRIMLTGGVVITILGFKGRQCRVGIEAPPEIEVLREEVAERLDRDEKRRRDAEDGGQPS